MIVSAVQNIIVEYQTCVVENKNIKEHFDSISLKASLKGLKYSSIFSQIGIVLQKNEAPNIKDIYLTIDYFN